jgi:hypothetical protein
MGLDVHAAAFGEWVQRFVRASNRMSGIVREPTPAEISAHRGLLAANTLRVENLEMFVHHVAGARMRGAADAEPDGEPISAAELKADLATIVMAAQTQNASPARLHRIYTMLRPFTDGNRRCGRALVMWQMLRERRASHGQSYGDRNAHVENRRMPHAPAPSTLM